MQMTPNVTKANSDGLYYRNEDLEWAILPTERIKGFLVPKKGAIPVNKLAEEVIQALKERAKKIAPDYPNIDTCDWREDLWAIESSYEGTCMANDDLHKLIDKLRIMMSLTKEDIIELSKQK